jgi:adenosylcobinamide-GDP ribazoletransferase
VLKVFVAVWLLFVAAVLLALVLAQLWLMHLTRRLGGYTGDGLGAAEQISQIAVLIFLAGVWL